jgi:hypothetical protein
VHVAPDLRRLEGFVKLSFEELREAAGVRPPANKPGKRKVRAHVKVAVKVAAKSAPVEAVRAPIPLPPAASRPPVEPERELNLVPLTEQEKVHTQFNVA